MTPGRVLPPIILPFAFAALAQELDLTSARIEPPPRASVTEQRALETLRAEVAARVRRKWPAGDAAGPLISVRTGLGLKPEGYRITSTPEGVLVEGADPRGVLFGVGKMLRMASISRGRFAFPAGVRVESSPETPLRGHQLGYRPKPNSYDGWTVEMWEQYIRDLAVFGTNAIELIPPRSDDDPDSPHFPLPQIEMMAEMSRIGHEYGMEIWVWYPAMDEDYRDPKTVEFALREWGDVFQRVPHIDHVLVPAGDPGHTAAKPLMALLEKQAANLRARHPGAGMWVAPQGFDAGQIEDFFEIVRQKPAWLTGLAYGPQTRISMAEVRRRTPAGYPLRNYPDITHTRMAQFPVPDWDASFAATQAREPVNPRPLDQAAIYRVTRPLSFGFITYSEGCNDDVNKFLWSGMGWSSKTPIIEILREYSRYFIGPDAEEGFAQGLLALERNWKGPVAANSGIETTLAQFQDLERRATPQQTANWRFQQALYRAYYDAFVRARHLEEAAQERRALERLGDTRLPPAAAMEEALRILNEADLHPAAAALRARLGELAEALYQSIRMQLSVDKYGGQPGRGNNLDTADAPLNSREWLREQFARIAKLAAPDQQRRELAQLAQWSNPGPGGFYDDLGNPARQPHLIRGSRFERDPQSFEGAATFFDRRFRGPRSWWTQAISYYDRPLEMQYSGLDPKSRYRVRVVYGAGPVRLEAEGAEIHGYLTKPFEILEFDVPAPATADGELRLTWRGAEGAGGAGRGCQIAEVWLMRRSDAR
jgi:hypothetical protein